MNDKLQDKDGTQIACEKCKGSKFSGLTLSGRSKQVTTTGAQLFPPPTPGSQEKNGITIDCMEDGKIHISGTAEILTDFYVSRMQLSAGTYTSSGGVNIDASVLRYALVDDIGVPYFDVDGDYTTDTIAETIDVSLLLRVYAGKSIDLTVQPMLNAGSTPLPWEPYTGGLPSPSPDYPQEIESVGQGKTIGINVRGKNLIPFPYPKLGGAGTEIEEKGMKYTVQDDGGIRCAGTPSSIFGPTLSNIKFSDKFLTTAYDNAFTDGKVCLSGRQLYFDSNNNALFIYYVNSQVGEPLDIVIYPQIELGTVATPYEPYHEPQFASIATPNGLPGIPVSSGGNYTAADGKQWVCDEIDLARGVYVQRVAKKLLTSTGKYNLSSTVSNKKRILISDISANTVLPAKTANTIGAVMTDFLFAKSANQTYMQKEGISVEITGHIAFYVETIQTVEQAQEYFKDKPMTLYYALAAPIETNLTSDQLATYKQLHTYADSTAIISNDANAYMGVTYRRLRD